MADFFAEVFASLDANPREILVETDLSDAPSGEPIVIDLQKGEPVFLQTGRRAVRGHFGGRWLAEHEAPLTLTYPSTVFRLRPTTGSRICVQTRARA